MVKRVYDLYPRVYAWDNLVFAERDAARGKRGRPDVARFEYRLEDQLIWLQEHLRAKMYRPGPYRRFTIREPKERVIAAAPYRDRVVHHALCRVIEPYFERRFIPDSYASRLGKGTHQALDRCTALARRYPYVLRCDIVRFFPSMDHAVMLAQLGRVIGDRDVLALCAAILAGGAEPEEGDRGAQEPVVQTPLCSPRPAGRGAGGEDPLRPHGLPIGNQTSQFWANVYLDALDQFVKRELRCQGYVRYVDDFLLFADDKPTLHAWKQAIIARLATLRLELHERESAVFPVSTGIPFLGFRVYPDHRRLRRRNGVAFARRLRALARQYAEGQIAAERLRLAIQGWVAHARHGDTYRLRRSLLGVPVAPPAVTEHSPST